MGTTQLPVSEKTNTGPGGRREERMLVTTTHDLKSWLDTVWFPREKSEF